jgi:hypothetical protein
MSPSRADALRALLPVLFLLLGVAPGARAVQVPPPFAGAEGEPAREQAAGFAWTALRCAAAAEASGLSADAAEWPARARSAVAGSGAAALERALPERLRTHAASWHERAVATSEAARFLAGAGAALHRFTTRAGGAAAAADRLLDAAALAAVAVFALRLAWRPRAAPRR